MKTFKNYLLEEEHANETPSVGDVFELEMARDETLIETTVVEVLEDGIVINADDTVMKMFEDAGYLQEYWTGMDSVALGGNKSPVGSRSPKKPKFTEQQIQEGKMKELLGDINELTHDEFSGKYNMSKDEAREKFDIKDEEELDEMSAMRRLAGMMQDKENIKNTRIPSHDERRIQVDLIDLSDEEFEAKHKMSKAQAREKFNEAHDASAESTEEQVDEVMPFVKMTYKEIQDNIKRIRLEIEDGEREDVAMIKPRLRDLLDMKDVVKVILNNKGWGTEYIVGAMMDSGLDTSVREELAEKFKKQVSKDPQLAKKLFKDPQVEEASGEKMSEPTQDAFQELKDYAETSGGIDKEEFEKAAYLVKAMGKPHLKDKAEGMLDDLIGKMDSDPRDKVIQVLARHIDLTFLKNLFRTEEVELDEKYDSDKFFDGKGTPEQRTQLLKLQNKALRAFPSSPKQKEIKKEIDALRKKMGMKVKEEVDLDEAEYQGRKVTLNKPTRGDVKKFKVYVKDPKTGNVKKVNFGHGGTSAKKAGQKTMKIKKSNPARRKSFRARHNCDNPGPKTKARYWSCRAW